MSTNEMISMFPIEDLIKIRQELLNRLREINTEILTRQYPDDRPQHLSDVG